MANNDIYQLFWKLKYSTDSIDKDTSIILALDKAIESLVTLYENKSINLEDLVVSSENISNEINRRLTYMQETLEELNKVLEACKVDNLNKKC